MGLKHIGGFQLRLNTPLSCHTVVDEHNTSIAVPWDTIDRDQDGYFDLANPTEIVIPEDGQYQFQANFQFASSGFHEHGNSAYFRINDGTSYSERAEGYSIMLFIDRTTSNLTRFLKKGDVVEVYVFGGDTGATVQGIISGRYLG